MPAVQVHVATMQPKSPPAPTLVEPGTQHLSNLQQALRAPAPSKATAPVAAAPVGPLCVICHCPMSVAQERFALDCGHCFHANCLETWAHVKGVALEDACAYNCVRNRSTLQAQQGREIAAQQAESRCRAAREVTAQHAESRRLAAIELAAQQDNTRYRLEAQAQVYYAVNPGSLA